MMNIRKGKSITYKKLRELAYRKLGKLLLKDPIKIPEIPQFALEYLTKSEGQIRETMEIPKEYFEEATKREAELRNNPAYCRSMDYMTEKMREAEERYGPTLGVSPAAFLLPDLEYIRNYTKAILLAMQKERDKDKKVVSISDYEFLRM